MKLYPNQDQAVITNPAHPIFKFVESEFNTWIDGSNPASEYKEQYFGDEAILDKRGAIEDAINSALEQANEDQKPVDLGKFDLAASFE